MLVRDIQSIEEWTKLYVEEGQRFLVKKCGLDTHPSLERRQVAEAHLRTYITQALQTKATQLRESESRGVIVGLATIAGTIPFGKWIVRTIGAGVFREKALEEYGLDYDAPVVWLILQAMADAGVIESKPQTLTAMFIKKAKEFATEELDFAWHKGTLQDEVHDELVREFGEALGDELFHEAAALVPIIGTIVSCSKGQKRAIKKLDAIIESTQEVARRVHESIVLPVVLERLGLGWKELQGSKARKPPPVPIEPTPHWESFRRHYTTYQSSPSQPTIQRQNQVIQEPKRAIRESQRAIREPKQAILHEATTTTVEPSPKFIFITVFALMVCIVLCPESFFRCYTSISKTYWIYIRVIVAFWSAFWRRTMWTGGNWTLLPKMVFVPLVFIGGELVLVCAIIYEIGIALRSPGANADIQKWDERRSRKTE